MTSDSSRAVSGRQRPASGPASPSADGEKPTVWEAVTRLAEVSQRLLVDRFELLRIETKEDMHDLFRTLILILVALPVFLLGWVSLMAGLTIIIEPYLKISTSLLILGLVHLVAGGVLAYIGFSGMKSGDESGEDVGDEQ